MQQDRLHILEKEPVYRAITKLALPMVLGMIVQILYNMTDAFFIGKLNDPNQQAAVFLAMPLFMMLMALGGILGTGGASYLSRAMGQKNLGLAAKTVAIAFYSCIGLAILITIPSLIFLSPIVEMLGTSTDTFSATYHYSFIILLCSILIMSNFTMGQLLRAEGATKEAMFGMLIGTVVNIILDPLFIFGLKMGVAGAAIATVLGNLAGLIYYIHYYRSKRSMFSLSIKMYSFDKAIYKQILMIGIPASLNQVLMSVASIISNNIASDYGVSAVAAIGVAMRIILIAILITVGVAIGCQPLIGYSYGAGNMARLKETIKKAMIITTVIGVFFSILFWSFSKQFILILSSDQEVVRMGVISLKVLTFSLPFLGIQMVIGNAVQAMGKAAASLFLSIARQGVIYIPTVFLLNYTYGFYGFIYAQPITDILVMVMALIVFIKVMSKYKRVNAEHEQIVLQT